MVINWTISADILVTHAFERLDESYFLREPSIGFLLNMLARNFEHVEAAITAFVTGYGTSSEVVSRAAFESSVNILYILAGDKNARLRAYFEHYLVGVDRQIDSWLASASNLPSAEVAAHEQAAQQRRKANEILRELIGEAMNEMVCPEANLGNEAWPKTILQRFENVGLELNYRTIYARMSSETHNDAEETLRYFYGMLHGNEVLEAMALETVNMSRFFVYWSAHFFIKASIAFAMSYCLDGITPRLKAGLVEIETELTDISTRIGGRTPRGFSLE